MDVEVRGDVLIICKQSPSNELIFRFSFHTAFIINTEVRDFFVAADERLCIVVCERGRLLALQCYVFSVALVSLLFSGVFFLFVCGCL